MNTFFRLILMIFSLVRCATTALFCALQKEAMQEWVLNPPPSIAFLVHSNVRQQEQSTVFWQVILHKVILGIIPTTCTVMKAIAEKQKVEKTFSQRVTEVYTHLSRRWS